MDTLKFDLNQKNGSFKIMHAVNNGPVHKRHSSDQLRSNFIDYKAARIPYARNHDAAFCASYGGEFSVDITGIFPNFDADVNDPASYNFETTDEYILVTLDAGTQTFYRLGQKIEHYVKKFGTIPPKDFKKWAQICEHIIMHYNEGWANGFNLNIEYWEIWNEADLDEDDSANKRTWGGTKAEFFDLYEITAKHLKSRFPHLKIGGPALAWREDWAEDFLKRMQEHNVPMDFFSWHIYCTEPVWMVEKAERFEKMLEKYGYGGVEQILNEWNYVKDWEEKFVYSIETIIGMKGAAFTLACMSAAQHSPIDMLMYYDARPCAFNGLFDFYTYRKLKGYWPFKWYADIYDTKSEILCQTSIPCIYTLCGVDDAGKTTTLITYYTDDDDAADKSFNVDFGRDGEYNVYLLDAEHDAELITTTKDLSFTLKTCSCLMITEK